MPPGCRRVNGHRVRAFDLGELGMLELVQGTGQGLDRARLPAVLEVTARATGEQLVLAGTTHGRPLRKWLQESGVLPWRRAQVPILRTGGEIVAVGDLACAARFAARPGEPSWTVAWRGRPQLTETEAAEVKLDALDSQPRDCDRRRTAAFGGRAWGIPIDCSPVVLLLRR